MRRWIHNDTPCRQEPDGDMGFEVEIEDAKDYDKLRDEVGRRYSVDEIRHYLLGGLYTRDEDLDGTKCIENTALLVVIRELEDSEDGIASVIGRLRKELAEVKAMQLRACRARCAGESVVEQEAKMYVKQPDCASCIRYDAAQAAQDPHYVCTASHTPFPRDCWDSHAREQPVGTKKPSNGGPQP